MIIQKLPGYFKEHFETLERGFTIFVLFMFTEIPFFESLFVDSEFSVVFAPLDPKQYPIRPITSLILYLIIPITLALLFQNRKQVSKIVFIDSFVWGLTLVALVSFLWSDLPLWSARLSLLLLLRPTIFGLYLAARYSLREQLRLAAWALVLAMVVTLIFTILLPNFGVESGVHAGDWRGPLSHKNNLGRLAVLSTLSFIILSLYYCKKRYLIWTAIGLSTSILLLSTSKTALFVLILLIALVLFYRYLQRSNRINIAAVTGVISLFIGIVVLSLVINPTLTFRVTIWSTAFERIRQQPWLGYGYRAFWRKDGAGGEIWELLYAKIPHAHNGFLDFLLEVGIVGLVLFLASFIWASIRAVVWLKQDKTPDGVWPLAFLSFFLLSNLTETTIFDLRSLFWLLFVAITFSLPKINPQKQQKIRPYRSSEFVGLVYIPQLPRRRRSRKNTCQFSERISREGIQC